MNCLYVHIIYILDRILYMFQIASQIKYIYIYIYIHTYTYIYIFMSSGSVISE
ncbi:MAG: hypothetical protein K6253_01965 [Candidatus Liberibacter asiaticus]|nr:hypothetical protein [Candidatus Liberibacter asiaticus]